MSKQKVLLINTNTEKSPYPVAPLGLCLLASYLKDKYDVKVFDSMFDTIDNLLFLINNFSPDYIGISIRNIDNMVKQDLKTYYQEILNNFITPIKLASSSPIILGGSGFSIFPNELMKLYNADYGIVGEGEIALLKLLQCLEKNEIPNNISGLISKGNHESVISVSNNYVQQKYSNICEWIDFKPYMERGAYPIQTKRGCTHMCIYCTYPILEGKCYRLREASDIVDEIQDAYENHGILSYEFVDSTFNDPLYHAENICKEIIKRGLKIRLRTMGLNPANVTLEFINQMLKAGFAQIDCTPDSASEKMLKSYKKNFSLNQLIKTAEIIKESNLPAMWFFIFGGPGETKQSIDESFAFIDNHIALNDMVYVSSGLRIYPSTPLYQIASDSAIINKNASLLNPEFYFSENISEEELKRILDEKISTRPNCIHSHKSTPSQEMLKQAMNLRNEMKLEEPMFRTLLRIKKDMFDNKW